MEDKSSLEEDMGKNNESRLARWSRRKAEQKSLSPAHAEPEPNSNSDERLSDSTEAAAEQVVENEPELPVLTDADMPPVESLNSESDFSGFLSPGVSEELRKLALRKLFSLASFQVRDGLDDYDQDFTVFEPLGDTVTNDPWTHRQKRLAEEKAAADQAEADRLRLQSEAEGVRDDDANEISEDNEALSKESANEEAQDGSEGREGESTGTEPIDLGSEKITNHKLTNHELTDSKQDTAEHE